jgi:hypothetical protein
VRIDRSVRRSGDSEAGRRRSDVPQAARRVGYVVSAAVNVVLLVVANNLLEWDVLPWLTDDFERVVGILTLSLGVSALGNVALAVSDPPWFKSAAQAVMQAIGFVATLRLFQVYPVDFSAYDFNWDVVARGVLILALVGTAISVLVELGKLGRELQRTA